MVLSEKGKIIEISIFDNLFTRERILLKKKLKSFFPKCGVDLFISHAS